MTPSIVAWNKQWFLTPWELERDDRKNFASPLNKSLELGEDGDMDVFMNDNMHAQVVDDEVFDDNLPSLGVVDA